MAKVEQITCDICGIAKTKINNWWLAYDSPGAGFVISHFDDHFARQEGVKAACGQEHVHKLLDEFLQKPVAQS